MSKVKTDLKIDLNNLDKSDWKTYRFDEIAINISERIDPNNTDLTVYIGLEHIDSKSLHIKRHGTPDDVNGTKLKFYKGDIIFGRRRAYQRKAGIATWDGFCSAHALVLRANSDVIDPELFPFFLHSDLFMNRAMDISVGSLSPTINWGTLKHQEFLLPPKELHKSLSQLLQSAEELSLSKTELLKKLSIGFDSYSKFFFKTNAKKFITLGECAEIIMGQSPSGDSYNKDGNGYPLINGPTEFTERYPVKVQWTNKPTKFCKLQDILLCVRGSTTGRMNISNDEYCIGRGVAAIRGKGKIKTDFLEFALRYNVSEILRLAAGSTFPNIDSKTLKGILLPDVDEDIQEEIIEKLIILDTTRNELLSDIDKTSGFKTSIINKVF
jgi:type I restriction enzyme S subunit